MTSRETDSLLKSTLGLVVITLGTGCALLLWSICCLQLGSWPCRTSLLSSHCLPSLMQIQSPLQDLSTEGVDTSSYIMFHVWGNICHCGFIHFLVWKFKLRLSHLDWFYYLSRLRKWVYSFYIGCDLLKKHLTPPWHRIFKYEKGK